MPELHETRRGRDSYDQDFPQILKNVGTIAKALESINNLNDQNYDDLVSQIIEIAKEKYHQEQLKKIADEMAEYDYKVAQILDMYKK
ncbi:hypothetical protein LGQ02_09975 [Bacillus shivajii]|uniref:hypothetical protein n=1 Tax=Bacillus shivajii TaxID=1983719 RepID=UPI001CFADA5E|nr:hypothetical protein [Bacillus shivajii]UCZ55020.1 hypothetical protein LGQ02_09975 [Bacillus shivajii]